MEILTVLQDQVDRSIRIRRRSHTSVVELKKFWVIIAKNSQ